MEKQYFFGKDGQRTGPFDADAVRKQIADGSIMPETLAWCDGMNGWIPAGQIPEMSAQFKTGSEPPPLPQDRTTPPPLPGTGIPAGLSPMEEKAYRFATAMYRPWKGKHSPIGAYVRKNPKSAVYVSAGTVAVIALIVFLFIQSLTPGENQGQQYARDPSMPTGQMPPANWQAGHQAMMGAQKEIADIGMEVYKYKQKREDKMDDLYSDLTYGTNDN